MAFLHLISLATPLLKVLEAEIHNLAVPNPAVMIACIESYSGAAECRPLKPGQPRSNRRIVPGSIEEEELVREHLPLVKIVVGRLAMSLSPHADFDDLHSSGLVGLLHAARKYDPQVGSSFEAYACLRIRGAVLDELRRLDWVPRSVHGKARKVRAVMRELEQVKGALPTDAEMAGALKLSLVQYGKLLEEIRPATFVSLDSLPSSEAEEGRSRHEDINDETQETPTEVASRRELTNLIAGRIRELPKMQRQVLALYYFEDMRLREIGAVFGVTESRICQIHTQAILALRVFLKRHEAVAV
jgi:RNA polymerase sigma factor for flagellar operon FliA